MKSKPNTDQFKLNKDPSGFLDGGAADAADREGALPAVASQAHVAAKAHREQKIFRLLLDLIAFLKRESYERSLKTGSRVTETELVEQALRGFYDI